MGPGPGQALDRTNSQIQILIRTLMRPAPARQGSAGAVLEKKLKRPGAKDRGSAFTVGRARSGPAPASRFGFRS